MGVNVLVWDKKRENIHPYWVDLRIKRDTEFVSDFLRGIEIINHPLCDLGNPYCEFLMLYKPKDIKAIKDKVWKLRHEWDYDIDRYMYLLTLLENDEWWLEVSW